MRIILLHNVQKVRMISTALGYPPSVPSLLDWPRSLQVLNVSARPLSDLGEQAEPKYNYVVRHTGFFLAFDFLYDGLNLRQLKALQTVRQYGVHIGPTKFPHRDLAITFHDTDLDVLRTSLDDFQETLNSQFDCIITAQVIFVILLQELPDCLRRSADGVCL